MGFEGDVKLWSSEDGGEWAMKGVVKGMFQLFFSCLLWFGLMEADTLI